MKLLHAMLVAMVGAPNASLTRRELVRRFGDEFEAARRDRLIGELDGAVEYVANEEGRRRRVVVEESGAVLIDEDDPDEEPERWPIEDVRRWRVAPHEAIDVLRSRYGLSGECGVLDHATWLLGDAGIRRVILTFARNAAEVEAAAQHARDVLSSNVALFVVSPSVVVSLATAVAAKKRSMTFASFNDRLELAPPLNELGDRAKQAIATTVDGWRLSADFRTARSSDDRIDLTPNQAHAVEIFYRQLLMGDDELSQDYVLAQAEVESKSLYQVFRRSRAWGQLVVPGSAKGMFRLNIVSPQIHR